MINMKLIIAILVLAIVLVAGCTQQQSEARDNFTQESENASKAIHEATEGMKADLKIELARNVQNVINVGMRNIGTVDIYLEKITVYVDEEPKSTVGNTGILNPGQVAMFNVTDATNSCNKTLKVVLSSGREDMTMIKC
jgi:archaellum component FlaG (FlaF/FlaG flagellin family)